MHCSGGAVVYVQHSSVKRQPVARPARHSCPRPGRHVDEAVAACFSEAIALYLILVGEGVAVDAIGISRNELDPLSLLLHV